MRCCWPVAMAARACLGDSRISSLAPSTKNPFLVSSLSFRGLAGSSRSLKSYKPLACIDVQQGKVSAMSDLTFVNSGQPA